MINNILIIGSCKGDYLSGKFLNTKWIIALPLRFQKLIVSFGEIYQELRYPGANELY